METQLLRDPDVVPSDEVLKKVLGDIYPVYKSFMETITNADYTLEGIKL